MGISGHVYGVPFSRTWGSCIYRGAGGRATCCGTSSHVTLMCPECVGNNGSSFTPTSRNPLAHREPLRTLSRTVYSDDYYSSRSRSYSNPAGLAEICRCLQLNLA